MTTLALEPSLLAATGFDYALQQPLFPGKLLLWGLFMLSLLSWGVIVSKIISFVRQKRADEEFLKYYRGGNQQPLQLFERNYEDSLSLRWVVYDYGAREAAFQMLGSPERDDTFGVRLRSSEGMSPAQMKSVREALGRGEKAAAARLRDGMPLLSVASMGAPFAGLLGMGWLLMKTFGLHGTAGNLADVSPGVSGALAILVVGLAVAVPSLVGQIILGSASRELMRQIGDFSAEVYRAFDLAFSNGRERPLCEPSASHHEQPLTAYERAGGDTGFVSSVNLNGDDIENAAASLESSKKLGAESPFVLIEDDDDDPSVAADRPIAAYANPDDDQPPVENEGFLFSTPFAESDDPDLNVNPIAQQTASLTGASKVSAMG